MMQIEYTQHQDIDKLRWDESIRDAANGNLYAYSWYLDTVCPGWEALTSKDYGMIMPLTGKKKYGFHYLFRPMLSQQLGLFSKTLPQEKDIDSFLKAIPAKFKLTQICLNKHNMPSASFEPIRHNSFELKLKSDYSILQDNFTNNHRRNIKKAKAAGLQIVNELPHNVFLDLLVEDNSAGSRILAGKKNLEQLTLLIEKMQINKALRIIGIQNHEGKTLAGVLFGYSHDTWLYLVPVSSDEGKEKRALFAIIDHLILNQAKKNEILDFEGSDIPGVAQFYSGFGAVANHYNEIQKNKLPWPINYLK
jgi:lipid II:glycine glycyltransferase (peptidoglycan interpeptide bridge formation enzyme)